MSSYESHELENEFKIWRVKRYNHETGVLQFYDVHTKGLRTYRVSGEKASKIVIH